MERSRLDAYLVSLRKEHDKVRIQPDGAEDCVVRNVDVFVELTTLRENLGDVPDSEESEHHFGLGPEVEAPSPLVALVDALLWYDRSRLPSLRARFADDKHLDFNLGLARETSGDRARTERRLLRAELLPHQAQALAKAVKAPLEPGRELERLVHGALDAIGLSVTRGGAARLMDRLGGLERPEPRTVRSILETVELTELIRNRDRLLVVGDPGSGKTTLLENLLLKAGPELGVPLWVSLSDFARQLGAPRGPDRDDAVLESYLHKQTAPFEVEVWGRRATLALFDGLDEVPEDLRHRVSTAVARLLEGQPRCRAVLTSRPLVRAEAFVFDALTEAGWERTHVRPLRWPQIQRFVTGYFEQVGHPDRGQDLLERLEATPELRPLAQTPVLLAMLVRLRLRSKAGLPVARAELYQECLSDLIEAELEESLLPILGELSKARLRAEAFQAHVLEPIAAELHGVEGTKEQMTENECRRVVREGLETMLDADVGRHDARRAFEAILGRGGLFVTRGGHVQFTHRTLREYLLAIWLTRKSGRLRTYVTDPSWAEALRLAPAGLEAPEGDCPDASAPCTQTGPRPGHADGARSDDAESRRSPGA